MQSAQEGCRVRPVDSTLPAPSRLSTTCIGSTALLARSAAHKRCRAHAGGMPLHLQDDVSEDEEAAAARHAADLAGMRVKHSADDLGAGETVILTLADRNILDDRGDLDEEDTPEVLEDVQSVRLLLICAPVQHVSLVCLRAFDLFGH